jgi:hypothetical protein
MAQTQDLSPQLQNLIRFVGSDMVHIVVNKRFFMELPKRLQGVTTDVSGEMIEVLRINVGERDDVFVFTSAERAFQAQGKLPQLPGMEKFRFLTVSVTPFHFLRKISRETASQLTLDWGYPEEMVLVHEDFSNMEKLFTVARLAKLDGIYLAHDGARAPVCVNLDDGDYAVGFVTEYEAAQTLETLQEESPGAHLKKMRVRAVVDRLLNGWPFEGIILNVGQPSQTILGQSDLRTLQMVLDFLSPSMFSMDYLKRVIAKVVAPPSRDPRLSQSRSQDE